MKHTLSTSRVCSVWFFAPGFTFVVFLLLSACSGGRVVQQPRYTTPEDAGSTDAGIQAADEQLEPDAGNLSSDAGDAGTDAGPSADPGPPAEVAVEARGVWVTRWDYKTDSDVRRIIREVAEAGFNQVYFQVRGVADAYYRSSLEPWAAALSGKLGKDPGWDPLQVAIEEAHRRSIELHAWINVATAWKGKLPPGRSRPRHLLRRYPRWRVADRQGRPMPYSDGYIFFCPALPGFHQHLEAVTGEIASYYDIDGLHLDYARYPAAGTSFDRTSSRLYRKARKKDPKLDRAAWQRGELTRLVGRVKKKVQEIRPGVQISAAVTGIYQDRWEWGGVTQGFHDFHQDSHRWAREKVVDTLIPMIYWKPTRPPGGKTDYLTLVGDFQPLTEHVKLLVGINVEAGDFDLLAEEIRIARNEACDGVVLFAYRALSDRGWLSRLAETVFAEPALARRPDPATAS